MTSYESSQTPQPAPQWPYDPASWQPATKPRQPGVETRQILLALGALSLIVAFTAGTALVWSALGRDGQVAVMVAVTGLLLAGAATIRRLKATAEALAAVGLAGCLVDAIAARTLHLSVATDLQLHSYVTIAALGVLAVTTLLWAVAPRLMSAPLAGSGAALVAAAAAVDPSTLDRAALLTPVGIATALALDRLLRRVLGPDTPVRVVNSVGGAVVATVGFGASLVAGAEHDPVGLCGIALPLALFGLPVLARRSTLLANHAAACMSGVTAALLLVAVGLHTSADVRAVAAVALLVLAGYASLPVVTGWARRTQVAVSPLAAPGLLAWASLVANRQLFADVDFILAAAAAGVVVAWPRSRGSRATIRDLALGVATTLSSAAAAITLALHHVTTPEAYAATPAGIALAWAAAMLVYNRRLSSTVLMPGLTIGLLPTLTLALDADDHQRQVVLLAAAAIIVVLGAQLRLGTPLAFGAAVIGLLSVRLVGPQLALLPRWLMFAAVGAILLTLGATWDARVADLHKLRGAVGPRIAALR